MMLKEILQGFPVRQMVVPNPAWLEREVRGVTQDSRRVKQDFIFVAIPGVEQDGHAYIPKAIQEGACAVVSSQQNHHAEVPQVWVENSRKALAQLSARFYGNPSRSLRVVGITGTNGKTTTSYLIESILQAAGRNVGVIGTVNYRYGNQVIPANNTTPESVDLQKILSEMLSAGVTDVVMEVSSHALTMERVYGVDFDVAAFTNLTQDHLDYHHSFENYFEAKKRLFSEALLQSGKKAKYAVINAESAYADKMLEGIATPAMRVGLTGPAEIACIGYRLNENGIESQIKMGGQSFDIQSSLLGRFNLENILVAIGVACSLGVSVENIQKGIGSARQVSGRLERIENKKGLHIFVDFAHTPDALARVGEQLKQLAQKKVITVFGCGGDRDRTKRPLMAREAAKFSDLVVVTSDNPRTENPEVILDEIMAGFATEKFPQEKIIRMADRKEAIKNALQSAKAGDMILVAGKGHEDYQIIGKTKQHFSDQETIRELLGDA